MGDTSRLLFTPEWCNYPRARFFKDRFMGLYQRFHNVIDALPKRFHDSDLMRCVNTLHDDLGQSPKVWIAGGTDITYNDIVVSANKQENKASKHTVPVEEADSTDVIHSGKNRRNDGPSIFVHFIDITDVSGADIEGRVINSLREIIEKRHVLSHTNWSNIIVFRTNETVTKSDTELLANCLQLESYQHPIGNYDIQILWNPSQQELPRQISLVFEKHLIDTFMRMFSDLKRFIRLDRRYDMEDSNVLYSEAITISIENIICNKHTLVEISKREQPEQSKEEESKLSKQEKFIDKNDENIQELTLRADHQVSTKTSADHQVSTKTSADHQVSTTTSADNQVSTKTSADNQVSTKTLADKIIRNICHSILCAAIAPLAAKFNLRECCCHQMLIELQFEENLINSISENTRSNLSKILSRTDISEEKTTDFNRNTECTVCIQNDVSKEFARVENTLKRMDQVVTVMRKMAFEIKGYLGQSDVARNFEDEMFHNKPISQSLREDIFRINGVYSLATVYGELEIGLTADAGLEAIEDARKILQKHHYGYAHKITRGTNSLTLYAGGVPMCFEQGDALLSPSLDKPNESRIGTLGVCLQGRDGVSYGLTCAHVVETTEDEVQAQKTCEMTPTKFGSISDDMMVSQHEESTNIRAVDIAAVSVYNCNECCYKILDDQIKYKPAMFAVSDQDENLTGRHVYKHGAKTSFTEGIVMSNDRYIHSQNAQTKFIIIEALPHTDDTNGRDSGIFPEMSDSRESSEISSSNVTTHLQDPPTSECTKQETSLDDSLSDDSSFDEEVTIDDTEQGLHTENNEMDHSNATVSNSELGESMLGCVRDSEMTIVSPENVSTPRECSNDKFADEGDSGALVCMTDLDADAILVVSMVSAGDSTSKNPICVSLPIESQMYELTKHI